MKDELIIYSRPKSNISEDIRTIRTKLKYICKNHKSKVLLITSSVPREGKSFISSNLALTFAGVDETVLLIDSDMRLGRIHNIFHISNNKGFSDLLISDTVKDAVKYIQESEFSNLYVIPRGVEPPNPSELLNSEILPDSIEYMKKKFDHIIFDGVPINGLPDSLVLAGLVDEVILVTAAGDTSIDDLNAAKKSLENINAKIAGVIVNKVKSSHADKYGSYYGESYYE